MADFEKCIQLKAVIMVKKSPTFCVIELIITVQTNLTLFPALSR